MNLVQFLKRVDYELSDMTEKQLKLQIHEFARTLAKEKRGMFLETMHQIKENNEAVSDEDSKQFYLELKRIKRLIAGIYNGERGLDSEYNPEWDDWYDNMSEEIFYSDSKNVISDIAQGINCLNQCIDREEYKEGFRLAEILSVMEVPVKGDANDYDIYSLELRELYTNDLLEGRFETIVQQSLYLAYMGNECEKRAEAMYRMMNNHDCYNISLEAVMQMGDTDLPEFEKFLLMWTDFLGHQTGNGAKVLLEEALTMLDDDEENLNLARKYAEQHPELYKQLLLKGLEGERHKEMLQIGFEAMDRIPDFYMLRSEVALLTAKYAHKLNDMEMVETCWIEAFRSDTSLENYMRIRFLARGKNCYKEEIKKIYKKVYKESKTDCFYNYKYTQRINTLENNRYCIFLFFDRDYERVFRLGINEENALGWSTTFMKQGLALFLLLLYKGEKLPMGLNTLLRMVVLKEGFQSEKFFEGTILNRIQESEILFWELFSQWKQEEELQDECCTEWLKMIESYLSMRIAGIMEANRRNYYGECAAFVAAYGEVCESRGMTGAKNSVMKKYKNLYSRRRNFHQELRTYGMLG